MQSQEQSSRLHSLKHHHRGSGERALIGVFTNNAEQGASLQAEKSRKHHLPHPRGARCLLSLHLGVKVNLLEENPQTKQFWFGLVLAPEARYIVEKYWKVKINRVADTNALRRHQGISRRTLNSEELFK